VVDPHRLIRTASVANPDHRANSGDPWGTAETSREDAEEEEEMRRRRRRRRSSITQWPPSSESAQFR